MKEKMKNALKQKFNKSIINIINLYFGAGMAQNIFKAIRFSEKIYNTTSL
jgi:hypothetical protein